MTYRSTPSSSRSSACCSRMHEIGHQTHRTEDRTAVNAGLSIDAVPHKCRACTGERQRYGRSRSLGVNNGGCRVEKEAEKKDGAKRGGRMMKSRHQPSSTTQPHPHTHAKLGLV